ncbi:uncharacterized protein LOC142343031, partial [Convolutriloba macropyga]|uniref:uncharacterized protein LOC142343031 n=1 Tax=Convolutriloba macropyga TaxID=536237 RepID=UPI003F51CA53
QEAVFFESMYVSDSSPYSFLWCPDDLVCVDGLTKGVNICHFDDGSPLYTFQCGTRTPRCLYGVANFFRNKSLHIESDDCDNGSFFASIPHLYTWIKKIMRDN